MRHLTFTGAIALAALLLAGCDGAATPTTSPATDPTAPPSAHPTATPTATPTTAPLTIPAGSLSLLGIGSSLAQSASVDETGYTGSFNIVATSCAGIATVSPSTGSGPMLALTVTGLAAGTCTATASDTHGQTAPLNITVTVSNLGVNAISRKP
jgi:hypothetical protein